MDLTSWHTPRTLKKSGLNLADFSVASKGERAHLPHLPSIDFRPSQYTDCHGGGIAVRCSVPIDKKKKDDGKYEIMMAVTMTQQEGPTA